MAKYIIDLPDTLYAMNGELRIPIRFGESPVKEWRRTGLNVKPHTEPDRSAIEDEVWEFVCKFVWAIDDKEILGTDILHAVRDMSYQEAKSKYEAWKKQEEEIHVGDEVLHKDYQNDKAVVTRLYQSGYMCADVLFPNGETNEEILVNNLSKTGRHFDEVDELLKKMRKLDD